MERDGKETERQILCRLEDGTNFHIAFPDWPELGAPCIEPDDPVLPDEMVGHVQTYELVYYLKTLTIPAGETAVVRAAYPLRYTGKLLFPACYQAIPCESHTLIIENAGYVELEDQNLGISDLSGTVRLDLDPTRTDYFMEFDVEMP